MSGSPASNHQSVVHQDCKSFFIIIQAFLFIIQTFFIIILNMNMNMNRTMTMNLNVSALFLNIFHKYNNMEMDMCYRRRGRWAC